MAYAARIGPRSGGAGQAAFGRNDVIAALQLWRYSAPQGSLSEMYTSIGGIEQWIEIGSESSDNPVLLYLHGGPGGSSSLAASAFKPWERHFTFVHWDQRGAGRTFARNGETGCGKLTIERMIADAVEIAEFLVNRLGRKKIILLGHSWGSVLGIHLVKRRPELVAAFVGTGQVVNMRRNEECNYTRQLAQARDSGNAAALAALEDIGPPCILRLV